MATLKIYPDPISDCNVDFEYEGKVYPFTKGANISSIVEMHLNGSGRITNYCASIIPNPEGFEA